MSPIPPSAVVALVDSLRRDPFYVCITEDFAAEAELRGALARYFEYSMGEGARTGRLVLAAEVSVGAAVWLLPQEPVLQAAEASAKADVLAAALGPKGANNYHRIIEFMAPRAQAVVSGSAWYLSIVGVSPASQGHGVGARLVEQTLSEADSVAVPCYLETFEPRNGRFYERLGFKVAASHIEPVTGSPYTIMHRSPKPTSLERTHEPYATGAPPSCRR